MAHSATAMASRGVGAMIVRRDESNATAGIVSAGHCVRLLRDILDDPDLGFDEQAQTMKIRDLMTPAQEMPWVTPDTHMDACMDLMKNRGVRHVAVLSGDPQDERSELWGVVSTKDLLAAVAHGFICPGCYALDEQRMTGSGDGAE